MERRRALMMIPHGLDTSPIITAWNCRWYNKQVEPQTLTGRCVSTVYSFTSPGGVRPNFVLYGTNSSLQTYIDGVLDDYWNRDASTAEATQSVKIGTNGISFTIMMNMLDVCYAYELNTGQIIFAGKNTIYYGHRNISELN